jgi:hypothetical protein
MPVAIVPAKTLVNRTVLFDFPDPVLNSVIGVAYWKFEFGGSDDHHVRRISLSVEGGKPSSRQVSATVNARLQDGSGHEISAASEVILVCVAETIADDTNLGMATSTNVPTGASGGTFTLPGPTPAFAQPFLSGWNVGHDVDDHHVKEFKLTAGYAQDGSTGHLTALAVMRDGSGHTANGSVSGGVIAANPTHRGLLSSPAINLQTSSAHAIDFRQPIKDGCALLQSLQIGFSGDDHHIKTIGAGTTGIKVVRGNFLELANARAFMTDDSGHAQDQSISRVSMVVLAIPL